MTDTRTTEIIKCEPEVVLYLSEDEGEENSNVNVKYGRNKAQHEDSEDDDDYDEDGVIDDDEDDYGNDNGDDEDDDDDIILVREFNKSRYQEHQNISPFKSENRQTNTDLVVLDDEDGDDNDNNDTDIDHGAANEEQNNVHGNIVYHSSELGYYYGDNDDDCDDGMEFDDNDQNFISYEEIKMQHEQEKRLSGTGKFMLTNESIEKFSSGRVGEVGGTGEDEETYRCQICDKQVANRYNLKRHMMIHTGEKPYGCDMCSKRFREFSDLRKHRQSHRNERNFKCMVCLVNPPSMYNPTKCTDCDIKLPNVKIGNNFRVFGEQSVGGDGGGGGGGGSSSSSSISGIGGIGIGGSGIGGSGIGGSGIGGSGSGSISNSIAIRSDCRVSDIRLASGSGIRNSSGSGGGFSRRSLNGSFRERNLNNLQRAIPSISRNVSRHSTTTTITTKTDQKAFICHFCDRIFGNTHNLKRHVMIHTGEKPFKCQMCDRSFRELGTLRRHLPTHGQQGVEQLLSLGRSTISAKYLHLTGSNGNNSSGSSSSTTSSRSSGGGGGGGGSGGSSIGNDGHSHGKLNGPLRCPYCSKTFQEKIYLKSHIVTHF